ncbi:MAG: hypothetical protein HFG28_14185 [Eubacterium sp.]|nr:hypothetical protein [Eubacterium sp.]
MCKDLFSNTTFTTVLSGSLVFIVGQLFLELFIKPWEKYQKTKSNIIFFLYKYRECILNPISWDRYLSFINSKEEPTIVFGQNYKEARLQAKELGVALSEFLENKGICFLIPKRSKLKIAINQLLWLSECIIRNSESINIQQNWEAYKNITKILHLSGVEKWKKHSPS